MPHAARPCGRPASQSASHNLRPCSIGTYSSQPRSPTYEMREASTRWVPISIVRQVPNLNPTLETSSDVVLARMSRARGPHSPIVVIDEVIDRKSTRLNSSHTVISYAVFCLKKKKQHTH